MGDMCLLIRWVYQDAVYISYVSYMDFPNIFPQITQKSLRRYWNTAGVEDSPYGFSQYSKWPDVVLKAVFHSSPSWIQTNFYTHLRSSFVKILALRRCWRLWDSWYSEDLLHWWPHDILRLSMQHMSTRLEDTGHYQTSMQVLCTSRGSESCGFASTGTRAPWGTWWWPWKDIS